jgi:hypothetical protein
LPDWRNFGVMLRVLLGINVLAMLAALAGASADRLGGYIELAAMVEPCCWSISGCSRCPQRFVAHAAACRAGVVVGLAAFWRGAFLCALALLGRGRSPACGVAGDGNGGPVAGLF